MSEIKSKEVNQRHQKKKYSLNRTIRKNLQIMLFKTFLLIRCCVDLIIDKLFSLYYDSKRVYIKKCKNPIVLESASTLAYKIRKGDLKVVDVVQAFIDRINETNHITNSLVDNRFEEALNEAKQIDLDISTGQIIDADFREKPFLGVPFTTKESTCVKGLSSTFGLIKRKGRKAQYDAECVELMKKAGGICLGVTNIPQLNMWQETSNPVYGITNNPYNSTRNVGGSSGGESSIIAACGSPIGIGSDIGGSIRIPAFMCGIFGHKTTSHLISTRGLTFRSGKEKQTMVVVGPMTKYAEDLLPFLKVLVAENCNKLRLDEPVNVSKIKVYYVTNPKDPFISPFRAEMKSILYKTVDYLSEIVDTKPELVYFDGLKYGGKLWRYWMTKEEDSNFKRDINDRETEVNPIGEIIKHFFMIGEYTTATIENLINSLLPKEKEEWAKKETDKLSNEIIEKIGQNGVLIYPSAPWTANYHHTALLRPWNFNLFAIWNALKFPVTQVPLGLDSNGLPMGVQVVAAPYNDRLCLAIARELEKGFGGYTPPFQT